MENNVSSLRVAILQRVCTPYRVPLFRALSEEKNIEFKLFIGDNIPESKVKNAENLNEINHVRLKSRFIKLRGHYFPIHTDLIKNLLDYEPDVIICEGESHFFGYLQAIIYKIFLRRDVKLIHWCFIALPGEDLSKKLLISKIKSFFRTFFDGFLVYSSYSKQRLIAIGGVPENKIFVATNVGDTTKNIKLADGVHHSKKEIRANLGVRNNFTTVYLGTLDENKRPGLLLEIAKMDQAKDINFLFLGTGPLLEPLRNSVEELGLQNVYLPGRVVENLPLYLKASDVLVIPGRGGIVISEAMSYFLPVIAHLCDGTEYDLIVPDENGLLLNKGDAKDFYDAIYYLKSNPRECSKMGKNGRIMVQNKFNTDYMVCEIIKTVKTIYNNEY
jgi:glycosyltransferase involved in cell wall biosynthesis